MVNLLKKNNNSFVGVTKKAVFLDRDGTLNEEVSYLGSIDALKLIPNVEKAIRFLNQAGILTVVVTNQSGVARGFFTEECVKLIHSAIDKMMLYENAFIDAWFYCPHHPSQATPELKERYGIDCQCRKPRIGMVEKACKELNIAPRQSYVVGDSLRDLELAWNVGAKPVLVLTGHGRHTLQALTSEQRESVFVADDLYAASLWIVEKERHETK